MEESPGLNNKSKFKVIHAEWCSLYGASLVAQTIKKLPAMQETQVQSLGQEDPLEKGMATHCSSLACRIPWTDEPGGLVHGVMKSWTRLSN